MPLSLGTCSSRAGTVPREYALHCPGRRHQDVNVLGRRVREIGSVTSMAYMNTGGPRAVQTPANEDAFTASVARKSWRRSRDI